MDCICPYGFRSLGGGKRIEARLSTDPRCPEHGKRAHLRLIGDDETPTSRQDLVQDLPLQAET